MSEFTTQNSLRISTDCSVSIRRFLEAPLFIVCISEDSD